MVYGKISPQYVLVYNILEKKITKELCVLCIINLMAGSSPIRVKCGKGPLGASNIYFYRFRFSIGGPQI